MSYWVNLVNDNGDPISVDNHSEGGTFAIGGTDQATLNVTYNYGKHIYPTLDSESGLRWLNGKKAKDTIDRLKSAVAELGTQRDADYWLATPGNAGYALSILLSWAEYSPDSTWQVR